MKNTEPVPVNWIDALIVLLLIVFAMLMGGYKFAFALDPFR